MAITVDDSALDPTLVPWTSTTLGKQTITDPTIDPNGPGAHNAPKTGLVGPNDPDVPDTGPTPIANVQPTPSTIGGGSDAGSQIDALYKQYGISDAGRGGGFADRAYWLEHPSEVLNGRLGRDLAGTGTDQPTGTPGAGPWLNSGRNAPEASIGQPTRDANGGFWDPATHVVAPPTPVSWTKGASAPTGAPPGQHWDTSQARFVDDSAPPINPISGPLDAVTAANPNLSLSQRQALIAYLLAQQNPTAQTPKAAAPPPVPPPQPGGGGGGQTPVDPNDPYGALP